MKIWNLENNKTIKNEIKTGNVRLAVYGLGKMGLPLAGVFAEVGFNVLGVDINEDVVEKINQGKSPVTSEPGLDDLLKKVWKKKRFSATTDGIKAAKDSDVQLIIVPTLVKKNKQPDLLMIKTVVKTIGKGLKKNSLVILESTVPPGITVGLVRKILEKESQLMVGRDFGLAFCPERTNSGTAIADIKGRVNPKIVGGYDEKSLKAVIAVYELINNRGVVPVSSCTVAEMVKLTEMVYRDIKIAYANSVVLICNQLGIDAKEVIWAANTDADCGILRPGPGVGGHCIPVYPYFIFDKVKKDIALLKSARQINETMPDFVVKLVEKVLAEAGKKLKESQILLLGITYRGNVKEVRFSPGLEIYQKLVKKAKKVYALDPLYHQKELIKMGLKSKNNYRGIDCLVITSLHSSFKKLDFKKIYSQMKTKTLVDTTFFFDPQRFKKIGFIVKSIGY